MATLVYFPIRGRGEPIRMTFAASKAEYREVPVDYAEMKKEAGTAKSPFGQAPFLDTPEGVRLSQMIAIMKYVAATHKPELLGSSTIERAQVDMVLIATDDLYLKYIACNYQEGLSDEGKAKLWATHLDPTSKEGRNGGAHLGYLMGVLQRSSGPFLVGASLTIADIFFYFTLECLMRDQCFGSAKILEHYPELKTYLERVAAQDGLKDRLADPSRATLNVNGNGKG